MILNSQSVKGLPVICSANGKRVGVVGDIRYIPGKKKIDGIVVENHQALFSSIYIPITKIITFEEAAVIVEEDYIYEEEQENVIQVLGRPIIRNDGQEIGTVSDIVFDSTDGRIEGYEISKGFVDDLLNGRNLLPGNPLSYTDGDVFIISADQSNDIKSNNRGIKNIFFNRL